jgi:hypothetical protein
MNCQIIVYFSPLLLGIRVLFPLKNISTNNSFWPFELPKEYREFRPRGHRQERKVIDRLLGRKGQKE